MNFNIRNANLEDADTIAGFQIAMALETEEKTLAPEVVQPAVAKVFADPGKGFYLVATSGENDSDSATGEIIGSLLITYEWSDWRDSFIWYIQSVFVPKPHRGKGVFKQLYARVMAMAAEQDVLFVRLYVETENVKAQRVYESLGMKKLPYFMYDIRVQP